MDPSGDWMGVWVDRRSDPVAVERRTLSFTCLESNLNPSAVQTLARRMIHLFHACKRISIEHPAKQLLM